MHTKIVITFVALAAIALFPTIASAGCGQVFCISGKDIGPPLPILHYVKILSGSPDARHYWLSRDGKQYDLGQSNNFSYTVQPHTTITFGLRACNDVGLSQKSCSPWDWFTHTVK